MANVEYETAEATYTLVFPKNAEGVYEIITTGKLSKENEYKGGV